MIRHVKLISYTLDSSQHDCVCGVVPLISKGHFYPSCFPSFTTPEMVPIAVFEAVKCNKTIVKDETDVIGSNIVYRYKPIAGAPMRWPGKKGLQDLGDHYNERDNESKGTEEEKTNKGISTQFLRSNDTVEEKKRRSKSKLAIIVTIPAVFITIVLIAVVVVIFG